MSICLDTSSVLTSSVGTAQKTAESITVSLTSENDEQNAPKSVAKIIVGTAQSTQPVKVGSSSVITVVNPPITVVKSVCSSTASHFTLVNSSVKSPTFTFVNAPSLAVLKQSGSEINKMLENGSVQANNGSMTSVIEKPPLHNVFVKKPTENYMGNLEVPQSHKILTASAFPQNSMMQNMSSGPILKTANGQRSIAGNKLKIFGNVVMQGNVAGPSNIVLNKSGGQRYYQQPKIVGNGATKFINKPNNIMKGGLPQKVITEKPSQRNVYPTHKSQIKTISPVNNYVNKPGIKTLSPQTKSIPGQVQRTGAGLRTIPPQRPPKPGNKPNYIGKHAAQAQKLRHQAPKLKTLKTFSSYHNKLSSNQMTVSQALTAEILESLGHDSSKTSSYETNRFESSYNYNESRPEPAAVQRPEYKPQSNLDTLSFVCQAVLLDHNYNATLPSESPATPTTTTAQMNGVSTSNLYSPGAGKRGRSTICSSNTLSSLSSTSLIPSNSTLQQDDDNASDISCTSERKDSEGEETDTAPEAEAVGNDDPVDRYGDYVTRCICGFIHDDGYMIECDKCKVWQHVRCVVRTKKVPDDYLCEECDPSKATDRHKARVLQQQWMREVQAREATLRKEQLKETLSDSDSSDGEHINNNNNFVVKGRRKSETQRPLRQRRESTKDTLPRRPMKRKEKKLTKRKPKNQSKSFSDDEKREPPPNQQLPQLRQWIENYEEAVTNHYSPELRARISNIRINGAHSELSGQVDPSVHKCKVQTLGSGIKYLVSTMCLNPGTPVIELRGKYMLSTQHRMSYGGALTTRQQRPGPFLFFYRLQKDNTEVCVDTRTYGNSTRFVRRSCQPNAELRHCIEKGVLHLYVVSISSVEKNLELTIRHESHDLAVVGTTDIPCACGNPEFCSVNKIKKNGDMTDIHRKRRGRRTISVSETALPTKIKEESPPVEEIEEPTEIEPPVIPEIKTEVKAEEPTKVEEPDIKEANIKTEMKKEEIEPPISPPPVQVSIRRSSQYKSEEEKRDPPSTDEDKKDKKLNREERKLQAIMKAIERMERQEQRKQEHQAKQAHRRESEPASLKDENRGCPKMKRRRRKGRARTISTHSQQGRRNRLDSADSFHATSSDETLLSPSDNVEQSSSNKAAGLLLALANGENRRDLKSPDRIRDMDSNSNSSPETPLSSACLLVAAAVEPLEPGFKFPKTKKGLMNEWLNKGTDIQAASSISPSSLTPHIIATSDNSHYDQNNAGFYSPAKNLVALAQAATFCDTPVQSKGNAKKRWLRQAISEDQCDSPCSSVRPESPQSAEMVAPPKKRKLPRESLSIDSPPTTPTAVTPPVSLPSVADIKQEGGVEIITAEGDTSPGHQDFSPDVNLNELAAEMRQEYGTRISLSTSQEPPCRKEISNMGCLLDPRLSRDRAMLTSDQLVGTVEKTLSFLGYGDKKPEAITPAKRKLSITEYRQRKKLNNNEKNSGEAIVEESPSSSQSPKHTRNRSNSSSSATSIVSSDEEISLGELPEKSLSAFNSEPTELERQRESVTLRLKKAFGLSVDEDLRKPVLNVETILKCDLPTLKTNLPLSSPTFPIPGSSDPSPTINVAKESTPPREVPSPSAAAVESEVEEENEASEETAMFYTPDDDDHRHNIPDDGKFNKVESTSYVPPFNNPLYPNSSYTSYGSVIDDDAPYEGRNPSPPPELGSA